MTRHLVLEARRHESLVSFDVNLRPGLWESGQVDIQTVSDLIHLCDLAKFSAEELEYLSGGAQDAYLADCFAAGLTAALVTDGAGVIRVCTGNASAMLTPPAVRALDTTGGGDAFIGAILFGLSQQADPIAYLGDQGKLQGVVRFAARCGAVAVTRPGAFPSFPTFSEVADYWTGRNPGV